MNWDFLMTNYNFKSINFNTFLYHLFFWVLFILYSIIDILILHPDEILVWDDMFVYYFGVIFLFYFFTNVTLKFLIQEKKILIGIIFFIFNIAFFYLIEYSRLWLAEFMNDTEGIPYYYSNIKSFLIVYVSEVIQFCGIGLAYWFYNHTQKQSKEKLALKKRNHEIEISFLKSQINQHFIYNMLNLFYVNAMQYSDKLADGIMSLSELMRFSVSHQQNSLIPVEEELQYTKVFIELNQLRFKESLVIKISESGEFKNHVVPHLCILTIVENAFKHGLHEGGLIELNVSADDNELNVSLKNIKNPSKIETSSTGVGLKNLERRLSLLLENRFSLKTNEDDRYFVVKLKIQKNNQNVKLHHH